MAATARWYSNSASRVRPAALKPRANSNEVMIASWETDRGLVPMVDPIYLFPFDERSWMGPAFGTWYHSPLSLDFTKKLLYL